MSEVFSSQNIEVFVCFTTRKKCVIFTDGTEIHTKLELFAIFYMSFTLLLSFTCVNVFIDVFLNMYHIFQLEKIVFVVIFYNIL